jgi:hypothetical protein
VAFTWYVWALNQPPPMPSYATIGFLGQYPFLLLGILLQVSQGDETRQFDLKLYGGQVIVPMIKGHCEVDITFSGIGEARRSTGTS